MFTSITLGFNSAKIWTDKADYKPGETVTIYGEGFQANSIISITVVRPDGTIDDPEHGIIGQWTVTADGSGAFETTYKLNGIYGTYNVTATDGTNTATTTFTDYNIDFRQYATLPDHKDVQWINSILQSSNSRYYEGDSVPQRIVFNELEATPNNVHNLTFSHQATQGDIHAYDFLTAWNQGNDPPLPRDGATFIAWGESIGPPKELAAICEALHNAPTSGMYEYLVEIPDDPYVGMDGAYQDKIDAFEALYGNRYIRICGDAPITSAQLILIGHDAEAKNVNSHAYYRLEWVSASTQILIELAGHLSLSGDPSANPIAWGIGKGASNINGGPYHFKLNYLDNTYSLGSQDNQIKGADILARPGLSLTKTPSVSKIVNGSNVTYTYVVTNTGNIALTVTLTDDKAGTIASNFALAAGASATYTKTVTITTANPSVTNTATATGTSGTGATVTATATATVQVIHPSITLDKDGPNKAEKGSIVTFNYTVTNTGDCSLNVEVTDDKLGSIWNGTLNALQSKTITKNWTATGDSMTNTATATGKHQLGTVTASDTHSIDVLNPSISITKSGTPSSQYAPGTVTWEIIVTNTGDIGLTVDVSDTRYGSLEVGLWLDVGINKTYTYTEPGLPPGTYTNDVTAIGNYQFGSVSATASATVEVLPVYILKQFMGVTVLPDSGFNATLANPELVNVYGLKSGPRVYFTVQYYFENSLNFLGDEYDGQAHNFTLWDKWGGNLMALGSEPKSFSVSTSTLKLLDGSSFNIDPRKTGAGTYRGYIGNGLDISSLASQGTAYITMHMGDQQQGTNPGKGKGTNKDSTSYDTDIVWYIGELAPGESATLVVYIAPGMNPGGQLEFTSLGCHVINTGPRVRAYGNTYENEDFLYAVSRTNTLTVCVYPK